GAVAQHAARDSIKPLIVPLHDGAKSLGIALKRAPHQFGIVQSGKVGFLDCRLHHDGSLSLLRCAWRRKVPRGSAVLSRRPDRVMRATKRWRVASDYRG